jgi:bifunctional non-homologous end joining protein LigD
MSLKDYSRKRNFARTKEPPPALSDVKASRFVVQRHHARRLHYDLRLEIGGVLKSWAVPQGPTLDPKIKRLAVHVEDHPIEYGEFEGTIPQGNYGAGTVTVWDNGTFEVLGDMAAEQQLERGDFKFQLHGHKLMGNFALVRIKSSKKAEWLLLKKPDFAAQEGWNAEEHLEPVRAGSQDPAVVPGAKPAAMPDQIQPMLATLATKLPEGSNWIYEIKWDGFRGICFLRNGKLRVVSRNGRSFDAQFPELQEAGASIRAQSAILDAEIVAFDSGGRPSFSLMQQRTGFATSKERAHAPVKLIAFDLLYLDGHDLRDAALSERRRLLGEIVTSSPRITVSEGFSGSGVKVLEGAREHGLEGVVAKNLDCKYESGRSRNWVKVKFVNEEEFVICGFTVMNRKPISSLVLGYYDADKLIWAGNAGTGFTDKMVVELHQLLSKLVVKKSPFSEELPIEEVTWLRPQVVCSVRFTGWGGDNHLRAPVFVALRPDQDPRDCVREVLSADDTTIERKKLFVAKKNEQTAEVGGRTLKFTNLNKVFYPAEGYTKGDVVEYYNDVAPLLVPHLAGRPLSLKRYPNGINSDFFFQKDASRGLASWLRTEEIAESEDSPPKPFVICDDRATLLYLANLGCIDQNPWLSRAGSLECPDFVVLDLDPYECAFDRIVEAAQLTRRKLAELELESYPKTTGGDGMHLYVPIAAEYTYEQVRTFAEIVARLVIAERPDLFTTPRTVSQREKGRVYFDYLQISWAKTISAPYVLRAYAGAPVATPLRWAEVKPSLSPSDFTVKNVRSRFDRLGDIFAPVLTNHQRLEPAMKKLEQMVRPR